MPQEIIASINAYIETGAVEADGITIDRTLVQPEACLNPGDLCVFLDNTEISADGATIGVATNSSDASWLFTMAREDGAWAVVGFQYTGG